MRKSPLTMRRLIETHYGADALLHRIGRGDPVLFGDDGGVFKGLE